MNFEDLARNLVTLFYPLVEVTFLNADGSVQEVLNAFSTLKEDQECNLKQCQISHPFQEQLASGRSVRCLVHPSHKGSYLRVRYDLTCFKSLQEQLDFLVGTSSVGKKTDQWKEVIDQNISAYLAEKKITLQATTAKQKRELISQLNEKGLFDFKESSAYVASKLHTSRATIYNYLKTTNEFQSVRVHQVDAFTNKKFGGNPAGVVLNAEELDDNIMRKIARELNLSETSFVLPSRKGDFQLRYFTPTGHEVAFCGHSTVGALYMIAREKQFGIGEKGSYTFGVETLCGILNMEIVIDSKGNIHVAYEAPPIKLRRSDITHEAFAKAGGIDLSLVDTSFPVMYEESNKDLFIVIKTLKDLKKAECDPKSLSQFCKKHDIVAVCLFTKNAFEKKNQFHMRCFAPMVGIPEDPFTGSVLGGLTAYVDTFKLLPKGASHFRVEQGHFIERPGAVEVEFTKKQEQYHAKILAQAVHCFSTEISLK